MPMPSLLGYRSVGTRGFEPPTLARYGSEPYAYTSSATCPVLKSKGKSAFNTIEEFKKRGKAKRAGAKKRRSKFAALLGALLPVSRVVVITLPWNNRVRRTGHPESCHGLSKNGEWPLTPLSMRQWPRRKPILGQTLRLPWVRLGLPASFRPRLNCRRNQQTLRLELSCFSFFVPKSFWHFCFYVTTIELFLSTAQNTPISGGILRITLLRSFGASQGKCALFCSVHPSAFQLQTPMYVSYLRRLSVLVCGQRTITHSSSWLIVNS